MALNLFGNLLEAVFLKQQCCDGNATTINAKDHDVLCAFSFVHPDSRAYVWWNEKPGSGRAGHDGRHRLGLQHHEKEKEKNWPCRDYSAVDVTMCQEK